MTETEREFLHKKIYTITPEERCRIDYGELTEKDFDTSSPNSANIFKTALGIKNYISYKLKHIEKYI